MSKTEKIEILYKLYDIINSREDLWQKVAELTGGLDYFLIEDTYERVLKILDILVKEIGETEDIIGLKSLIASSAQQLLQPEASLSAVK